MQTQKLQNGNFFIDSNKDPKNYGVFFPGSQTYLFVLRTWAQLRARPPPTPFKPHIANVKLPVGQAPGSKENLEPEKG